MPYKVEIYTKQIFPDGRFQNNTEEKWFDDAHELAARNDAFLFMSSFKPQSNTEIELMLYFSEDGYYTADICSTIIHSKEDLAENGLFDEDNYEGNYLRFNFENLHLEYESYLSNKYDAGGEPIVITEETITIYDDENGEEIELSPVILSANRQLFK
jgi:hypothetical protein